MGARQEGGFGAWITKRYLHVGSATHSRGRKRDEVAVTLRARALNRVCGTALPCGTAGALPPHAISCLGFSVAGGPSARLARRGGGRKPRTQAVIKRPTGP